MSLKLSEAIRLGSLLIQEPKESDTNSCAVGMALRAIGDNRVFSQDQSSDDLHIPYRAVVKTWPWLDQKSTYCPWCDCHVFSSGCIWHPFDSHVMRGEMTIEQLADWIATIEPDDGVVEVVAELVTEYVHA